MVPSQHPKTTSPVGHSILVSVSPSRTRPTVFHNPAWSPDIAGPPASRLRSCSHSKSPNATASQAQDASNALEESHGKKDSASAMHTRFPTNKDPVKRSIKTALPNGHSTLVSVSPSRTQPTVFHNPAWSPDIAGPPATRLRSRSAAENNGGSPAGIDNADDDNDSLEDLCDIMEKEMQLHYQSGGQRSLYTHKAVDLEFLRNLPPPRDYSMEALYKEAMEKKNNPPNPPDPTILARLAELQEAWEAIGGDAYKVPDKLPDF